MKFKDMKDGMFIKVTGDYADCIKAGDILVIHINADDPTEPYVKCSHGNHYLKSSLDKKNCMPEFKLDIVNSNPVSRTSAGWKAFEER